MIDYLTGYERHLEAAEYFDEAHVSALVARIVDRTNDMAASVMNHALAEEAHLWLAGVRARTLDGLSRRNWVAGQRRMCHSRVAWRRTTSPCARTTGGAWSGSG